MCTLVQYWYVTCFQFNLKQNAPLPRSGYGNFVCQNKANYISILKTQKFNFFVYNARRGSIQLPYHHMWFHTPSRSILKHNDVALSLTEIMKLGEYEVVACHIAAKYVQKKY